MPPPNSSLPTTACLASPSRCPPQIVQRPPEISDYPDRISDTTVAFAMCARVCCSGSVGAAMELAALSDSLLRACLWSAAPASNTCRAVLIGLCSLLGDQLFVLPGCFSLRR